MSTTTRIPRAVLALAASTALLGLAACSSGSATAEGTDGEATTSIAATTTDAQESTGMDTSDGGDTPVASDGGDGTAASGGDRASIVLELDVPEDSSGHADGAAVVSAEDLGTTLGAALGGDATCEDDLDMEPANAATCNGPASSEGTVDTVPWTAYPVMVPADGAFPDGSTTALLFVRGESAPDGLESILDERDVLTGLGFGSMFGASDLSAEQLAQDTLEVLTSENAYVPLTDADFSEVTCEDGMSSEQFQALEPVTCEAATGDGESFPLTVAPGPFAENDPGLLVGIRIVTG